MNQLYKVRISTGLEYESVADLSMGLNIGEQVVIRCEKYMDYATVVAVVGEPFEDLEAFERLRAQQNKGRHVEGQRIPQILRSATEDDRRQAAANDVDAQQAHIQTMDRIKAHNLEMKLIYTHYAFDRKLIIFQFSADGRIDFRELLRDLSGLFKVRVELRQVGVRDEASILGGVGTCGRPFCCAQFLKSFNSINVKMAKQQGLPLNPLNISGCCGRLKCCLQFEAETYREMNAEMKQKQSEESAQDSNATDIELPPEDMFDEEGTIVTAKPISIPAAEDNQDAQRGPTMTRQQHQQEKRKEHFQARQHASHDNPQQPGNAKPHNNRPNHNPPKKPLPPPAPGENGSAPAGENRHSQQGPRPPKPNGERRHGHRDHNRGDRNRAEQQAQNGNASPQHPQSTPQRDSSIGDFGN